MLLTAAAGERSRMGSGEAEFFWNMSLIFKTNLSAKLNNVT